MKLFLIGVLIFLALPLSARLVTPPHYPTQLKLEQVKKPVPVKKDQPKLEACTLVIIPIFWVVHYQCAADAFGGGGGRAF